MTANSANGSSSSSTSLAEVSSSEVPPSSPLPLDAVSSSVALSLPLADVVSSSVSSSFSSPSSLLLSPSSDSLSDSLSDDYDEEEYDRRSATLLDFLVGTPPPALLFNLRGDLVVRWATIDVVVVGLSSYS